MANAKLYKSLEKQGEIKENMKYRHVFGHYQNAFFGLAEETELLNKALKSFIMLQHILEVNRTKTNKQRDSQVSCDEWRLQSDFKKKMNSDTVWKLFVVWPMQDRMMSKPTKRKTGTYIVWRVSICCRCIILTQSLDLPLLLGPYSTTTANLFSPNTSRGALLLKLLQLSRKEKELICKKRISWYKY